jgi:glycosyltransferase involved in cell wall biosynthesis
MPTPVRDGLLARIAGGELPQNTPILIYSGAALHDRGLDTILRAMQILEEPAFLLAFCYGDKKDIKKLRSSYISILGPNRARICNSVPREQLLSCIHEASAGLVYYPYTHEQSNNQKFCAPSKFYEYIAAGVPVISSNNPSLVNIIAKYNLGTSAPDDSPLALSTAIKRCLFEFKDRHETTNRLRKLFLNKLCYEKLSPLSIEILNKL